MPIGASLARAFAVPAAVAVSLTIAAPPAFAADPPPGVPPIHAEPWTDVIIELRVGRVAQRTLVALTNGIQVLVPARPLFELIEMRTELDAQGCLRVVRQPEGTDLFVDGQLGIARAGTMVLPRTQVVVHTAGGELYLGTELIAGL